MKRRVGTGVIYSESVMVEDRYDAFTEEHLGVSNRNLLRVELDGAESLKNGQLRMKFYSALIE